MRRVYAGIAIALWWILVVLWFAQVPFSAPFLPQQRSSFDAAGFSSAIGQADAQDGRLLVTAVGAGSDALQIRPVEIFDATRRTLLHYSFVDFPRTMEMVLVFRRADQPDDVHTVPLASPRRGTGSIDLSQVAEWRGEIVEIGFAEFPAAQSVPTQSSFRPFALDGVELWTESWFGSLLAARHDWFAPRSWALLSISALGPDAVARRGRSPVVLVAVGIGGSIGLLLVFGASRRRLLQAAVLAVIAGWIGLDLMWLGNFSARHATTRAIYAGKSWAERQALVPDTHLAQAAERVREVLTAQGGAKRIIVDASSDYERARLIYHLLPLNVAPGNLFRPVDDSKYKDVVLVFYALESPLRPNDASSLEYPDTRQVGVDVLLEDPPLRIYRLSGSSQP